MTEKEKMLRQMLYDANNDTNLIEERKAAKDHCYDFNHLRPSDTIGQQRIMRRLLGKTEGDSFSIVAPFWCDYGCNIEIGENFFANHNTVILDGAKVKFGNNVFIAPNCGFHTAGHPIDAERRNQGAGVRLSNHRWRQCVDWCRCAGYAGRYDRLECRDWRRLGGGEGHPVKCGCGGQPLPHGASDYRRGQTQIVGSRVGQRQDRERKSFGFFSFCFENILTLG